MNKAEIFEIFLAQDGKCFYCGLVMDIKKNNPASFSKDHFKPRCKGNGLNGNAVLSHGICNWTKGHREATEDEKLRFKALYRRISDRRHELELVKKKYSRKVK